MSARKEGPENTVTHIRRCHVCGTVNELVGSANIHCHQCGKHLAPFYFFDESSLEGLSESGPFLSAVKTSPIVNPIWGLSTYWSDDFTGGDEYEDQHRGHQKSSGKHSGRHTRNGS